MNNREWYIALSAVLLDLLSDTQSFKKNFCVKAQSSQKNTDTATPNSDNLNFRYLRVYIWNHRENYGDRGYDYNIDRAAFRGMQRVQRVMALGVF